MPRAWCEGRRLREMEEGAGHAGSTGALEEDSGLTGRRSEGRFKGFAGESGLEDTGCSGRGKA